MITTIIPYQQATLYQLAAPTLEKSKAIAAPRDDAGAKVSIILSPEARARLADAAVKMLGAETADERDSLQEAARRTIAVLKRSQARDFTARGIEITDSDTAMPGRAVNSLRTVMPQPVDIKA